MRQKVKCIGGSHHNSFVPFRADVIYMPDLNDTEAFWFQSNVPQHDTMKIETYEHRAYQFSSGWHPVDFYVFKGMPDFIASALARVACQN